jgi:HSP20 family protein
MRYRRFVGRYVTLYAYANPAAGDLLRGPGAGVRVAPARWRPSADVWETAGAYTVTVDLAGVESQGLDVQLYADALVVEGERPARSPADGVSHSAEIRHGPFHLEVALPGDVDPDGVDATYDQGLLQITLPKAATGQVGHGRAAGAPAAGSRTDG